MAPSQVGPPSAPSAQYSNRQPLPGISQRVANSDVQALAAQVSAEQA
jgi:hypothetical protein